MISDVVLVRAIDIAPTKTFKLKKRDPLPVNVSGMFRKEVKRKVEVYNDGASTSRMHSLSNTSPKKKREKLVKEDLYGYSIKIITKPLICFIHF